MSDVNPTPESSSAQAPPPSFEIPKEPAAYAEWRKTGKLEAPKPAESAPAKKNSDPAGQRTSEANSSEADGPAGESGSASEAGKPTQEKKRSTAETRLNDLLADLKRAGLTPAELKTFKKEAQKAAEETTEHTEKPASQAAPPPPKQPEYSVPKPKLEDFDSIESFTDALTDWKADKREFEGKLRAQQEAAQKEVNDKLAGARARYGEAADSTIRESASKIFSDQQIPNAVKAIINDSPEMVDLLYTLGSDADGLKDFIQLAKTNPGQAIRKAVLMEKLVQEELSKSSGTASEDGTPTRDSSGKFVAKEEKEAPAKPVTRAPAPPREASGRSAAPPDAVEAAFKSGDFAAYRDAQNRRDLARLSR